MDFNFTDEQTMLRDSVARYLQNEYAFETRQGVIKSEGGWRPKVWTAFAEELGILGAPFSEELGGLGGGAIENMIVMEEVGKGAGGRALSVHGRDRRRFPQTFGLCRRRGGDRPDHRGQGHHRLRLRRGPKGAIIWRT